jgi:branched-chain amino acid transport system substrate-binding protein
MVGLTACGGGGGGAKKSISGNTIDVYASLPLQGSASSQGVAIENGAQLAVSAVGGKIGKYTIKYTRLDDSLASTGAADPGKGSQNARQVVSDPKAVAYVGEYNSGISKVTIPILNKGGVAQVSPTNTYAGLTTNKVPGTEPGEPSKYYPTGKRTYARVVPIDTVQAAALLIQMKADGCKSLHIWNSKTTYSAGLAKDVQLEAGKAGIKVEGNDGYDIKAANYRSLAANIHSDCFLSTGEIESNANQGLKDVGATHPSIKLYESDGDCNNPAADPAKGVPFSIAPRFKCTIATLGTSSFGAAGAKFFADYAKKYGKPDTYALYGYESMAVLLDAIKRASADGTKSFTRQDVVKQLLATKNRNSILGTYSFDNEGDTSLTTYGLYTIKAGKLVFDHPIKTTSLLPGGAKAPGA